MCIACFQVVIIPIWKKDDDKVHDGSRHAIVTGLFLPTAMIMGPDGNLYVSNVGFGPPPGGLGQVLKVEIE